jgi:L-malate glycosyltransferase
MKILVLIHEYPPVGGGGGRVAMDLCEALAERGHELRVLTAHLKGLPEVEKQNGVTIYRLHSGRKEAFRAGLGAMAGYVTASIWQGLKMIRDWKPDVIHVHFAVPAGAAAWVLSSITGVPYILTAHLGDVPGGVPEKTGKWFKFIFPLTPPIWKKARTVVAVSEFTRSLALQYYAVPVKVIPNGVDIRQISPPEIVLNQPIRIIFVGRFMPQKNPVGVVRILARLKDLPWKAVLIGDGPLRPAVEQEIMVAGLDERVELTGWIEPEAVLKWYRQCDLMLLPSLSEGLPVVGVQAEAMGLALVFSRAGGNVDVVVPGENGCLLEVGDEEGFATAIRKLLTQPQELLKQRIASRQLAARFDLQKVVSDYEAVFERSAKDR